MTPDEVRNVEDLSRKFHEIYQTEAKRQSNLGLDKVRHPDSYDELPERVKEYDRVLARYVLGLLFQARREAYEDAARIAEGYYENHCCEDCPCAYWRENTAKAIRKAGEVRNGL